MIRDIVLWLMPYARVLKVQPTINNGKPFGKPFKYIAIKAGYKVYMISFKPKMRVDCIGLIS
jgi:hypothetical protein